MGLVLGSQVESMAFTDDGIVYVPAGALHAVDLESPLNARGGITGYAVCGAAVRVWADRSFDPNAGETHDLCADMTRGAG